jgi:hypothetical protein
MRANLAREFATCRGLDCGPALAEPVNLAAKPAIPVKNNGFQRTNTLGQIGNPVRIWRRFGRAGFTRPREGNNHQDENKED